MKIIKYTEFINEELIDTPESFISTKLSQLKKKIDKMFDYEESDSSVLSPDKLKRKDSKEMSLSDLGLRLDSSDISKYSKLYDSLTVKFSDSKYAYTLIIMIDIKDAMPDDDNGEDFLIETEDDQIGESKEEKVDFDIDDINDAYIKFKKYDIETFEIEGQISKNIKIDDINEDFLIDLKLEIDDKFGDDEEFSIETKE